METLSVRLWSAALTCLLACPGCAPARLPGSGPLTVADGLRVESLGQRYDRNPDVTPEALYFDTADRGGSTSVRRMDAENLRWKGDGYFQRNRELGQVFTVPPDSPPVRLDAVVLRTGNSSSAVLAGAAGAPLHITLFAVTGTPRIDDNGTPAGTPAAHGFTDNHRADDFLTGITYRPLLLARGGVFPDVPATDRNGGQSGHLHYLRWDLTGDAELKLQPGQRYAFLVGFAEPGAERGFTLGNHNLAASPDDPQLRTDAAGSAWWAIRREGNGKLPPTAYPGDRPPGGEDRLEALLAESLFAPGFEFSLSPATDGYPDVDTYRTLEFYVELKAAER